ncbi:MAG: glycosyltransferase family 4 protein [Chitinophagales bacterium]
MSRHLHIVCLDAPCPPDYGGAIEMFGKIKALYQEGIKIHLHYFDYKNRDVHELNSYCETIHSYKRKSFRQGFSFSIPYIVSSRINDELVLNLNKDDHPVILEGIHCTGILNALDIETRKVLIRLHNDEAFYYDKLAKYESNLFKKIYFTAESKLLIKYQTGLPKNCLYACLSKKDAHSFTEKYALPKVEFLPAFTGWSQVNCKEGIGNFCLYHGNLSVAENEKAACWLLDKVFTKIKVPLVIAGKHPSRRLSKWAHLCQHTCLVADPSEKEMNDLLEKAHIHILPSFNDTGVKLKLLHALYRGRHCVVNPGAVEGSGLDAACHIGKNANAIASIVLQLHHQPFGEEEIQLRKKILCETYNNQRNAQKVIAWLY